MKPPHPTPLLLLTALTLPSTTLSTPLSRKPLIQHFNPHRTASSPSTPLQVGNGNFAFGADITGLQTFLPWNTLATWCWHNASLPTTANQTSPADFTGLDWWTHGRLVNYDQPNPAEAEISQWMVANPQRANLGRVGLWFGGGGSNVSVGEADVEGKAQTLDMYSGRLSSGFVWKGEGVAVVTTADPFSSTVAVDIESAHLVDGGLGVFFDYPYMTGTNKFEAFVGVWNATANHTTQLVHQGPRQVRIQHDEDATTYYTTIHWSGANATVSGPAPGTHQYVLTAHGSSKLAFTVSYHSHPSPETAPFYSPSGQGTRINTDVPAITTSSSQYWRNFWEHGAFLDLTATNNASATELQRRIIQSQYILAVNEAGFDPPQESGLVNNGWYGKFHAEMFLWHLGHWGRWGRWDLVNRAMPGVYERFLPSSLERARLQGYAGARWGKMSDPTGRSAPGEINSLLLWQQPHVMHFAEYEYRSFPTRATLEKWDAVVTATAEFMASFASWNGSSGWYDLGPPCLPMSENTDANATVNPAFELAYWRFGLGVAGAWKRRLGEVAPEAWGRVAEGLAPLPVEEGTYVIYEGVRDMWDNASLTEDHQSMLGIYGWLPPQPGQFNLTIMQNTAEQVYERWNFTYSYGWDFPLVAMNAARLGDVESAVGFLLHPGFEFDDAGYQVGGARVPTPYMPGASALLWAVAMLAGGWGGSEGGQFPEGWGAVGEGFTAAL
ncbi:hypothetical protein LTR08_009279 [Meristemomyces frigidus]|nr:hypothetical protein LTR08_009279 [Meristemomyces frigidus]